MNLSSVTSSMTSLVTRNDANSTSHDGLPMQTTTPMVKYQQPFDDAAVITTAGILLPFMVMGIIGNLLTIVTISISSKLRSVFNLFILSLCVSDLISALISPLYLYRRTWGYDDWNIPSFFCKLYWAADMWTSYVTALHILLFAILRLISIRWPHSYGKITRLQTKICIFVMWLVAFVAGFIPFAIWYDSGKKRRHSNDVDAIWPACTLDKKWLKEYSWYSSIAYSIFFYFPMIVIVVLTFIIGLLLSIRGRQRRRHAKPPPGTEVRMKKTARKEKEAMLQLAFIAGSFMLGYLPITAYEIASILDISSSVGDEKYWWNFGTIGYICLRVSEILNPVFYNLASGKMRRETKRVLQNACRPITTFCFGREEQEITSSHTTSQIQSTKFTGVLET